MRTGMDDLEGAGWRGEWYMVEWSGVYKPYCWILLFSGFRRVPPFSSFAWTLVKSSKMILF